MQAFCHGATRYDRELVNGSGRDVRRTDIGVGGQT